MKNFIFLGVLLILLNNVNGQWTQLNQTTPSGVLVQISFLNDSTGFAGEDGGYLFVTYDYGNSWNYINAMPGPTFLFLNIDTGFAGGQGLYKTTDGGQTWSNCIQTPNWISSIIFLPDRFVGYAACTKPTEDSVIVYKTVDRGNTWNQISIFRAIFEPAYYINLSFTSPDTGYMTGDGIRKTIDGGATWFPINNQVGWHDINFPTRDTGYVIGDGVIKKTTDGEHWLNMPQINNAVLYSAYFLNSNEGYIIGSIPDTGIVIRTIDGGLSWDNELMYPTAFYGMSIPSYRYGYICGSHGTIFRRISNIGIDEIKINNFQLYPNPFSNHIIFNSDKFEEGIITIFDYTGVKVFEDKLKHNYSYDLTFLSEGMYLACIKTDKLFRSQKIIKIF